MNNVRYTFQVDKQLKSRFLQSAKAANMNGAEILRNLMHQFVQQQAFTQSNKPSLSEKLGGFHPAANIDFDCERKIEKFRVAEFE